MDRPPRLNLIKLGNEWIATNGELQPDGTIRFPEFNPAEECFVDDSGKIVDQPVPPPPGSTSSTS